MKTTTHISRRIVGAVASLTILLTLMAGPALAQNLDLSGWQITQENSTASFTIPAGTSIQPGGYLVLGRFADQSAFETFYGVSLGSNVVYLTNAAASPVVPMINGDEIYRVLNTSSALVAGPTPAFDGADSHHLTDPEGSGFNLENDIATPGSGVEAPDGVFSGLIISEVTDATGSGNYIYEFVELYYDAQGGGGNLLPVIAGVGHLPTDPDDGDDLTLTATITDSDGTIDEARLYYRTNGGSYTYNTMTHTGDTYRHILYNVTGGTTLDYYVWARDNEDGLATSGTTTVEIGGGSTVSKVILFDHSHGQDAGSAGNWRVDNNHPTPYPTNPSSETAWSGQLSSWGYEMYLLGHEVRSVTSSLNASTLAGVDLLIIPEPQNPFTAAEIAAVGQYVFNGGSLFFITDHNSSDRNNNGWDSPSIFGGYDEPHITEPIGSDSDTFCGALFGLHIHVKDEGENGISGSHTNITAAPGNPIINGDYGTVTGVYYHVGNVMTLWPTANPHLSDVGGLISRNDGSPHLAAWSRYGAGKVVGYGDSSSMADGTGAESHENNWTEASHRAFFLNASLWLLASEATPAVNTPTPFGLALSAYPNPFNPSTTIQFTLASDAHVNLAVYDISGRLVRTLLGEHREAGNHSMTWHGHNDAGQAVPSGLYLIRANDGIVVSTKKIVLAK